MEADYSLGRLRLFLARSPARVAACWYLIVLPGVPTGLGAALLPPFQLSYINHRMPNHLPSLLLSPQHKFQNRFRSSSSNEESHFAVKSSHNILTMEIVNQFDGNNFPTTWSKISATRNRDFCDMMNNLFPPLSPTSHKGSHGRLGVIGGSEKYTGAPFYAAMSALRCGVDLATVFCAKEASTPIKCYSPELMVNSIYSFEEMDRIDSLMAEVEKKNNTLQRTNEMNDLKLMQQKIVNTMVERVTSNFISLHTLLIGPGLGRHPLVLEAVFQIILRAKEKRLFLVLDADALFLLSLEKYRNVLKGYDRVVLTPNLIENHRLKESCKFSSVDHAIGDAAENIRNGDFEGNIIVEKGHTDIIKRMACVSQSDPLNHQLNEYNNLKCEEEGGLKRSGGIGDVLAGTVSAFMAWSTVLEMQDESKNAKMKSIFYTTQKVIACWAACCAVKKATKQVFLKKGRSMSAQDVMNEIGCVISSMENELDLIKIDSGHSS